MTHFLEVQEVCHLRRTIPLGAPQGCRDYTKSPYWCRCQSPHTAGEPWTLHNNKKHGCFDCSFLTLDAVKPMSTQGPTACLNRRIFTLSHGHHPMQYARLLSIHTSVYSISVDYVRVSVQGSKLMHISAFELWTNSQPYIHQSTWHGTENTLYNTLLPLDHHWV